MQNRESRSNQQTKSCNQALNSHQQSLITPNQLTQFIDSIKPHQNTINDYEHVLATWNQFTPGYKQQIKKIGSVLGAKIKIQANSRGSDLCQVCYEEMTKKINWCRICGSQCCEKCVARLRVVKNQEIPIVYCEKCDREYINAMILKQEQKKFMLREKAFLTLAIEQQQIENTLKNEREKMERDGVEKNEMLKKLNQISQITTNNRAIKSQIDEIKKKIDWGDQISGRLKKKLKKIKKQTLNHSTISSVHEQQQGVAVAVVDNSEFAPFENLNQSIINSILETIPQNEEQNTYKCRCTII